MDWFTNDTDNVRLIRLAGANHSMPTSSFGSACSKSVSPYIAACHYDLSFIAIDFFYGYGATYPYSFNTNNFFTFDIGTTLSSVNKTAYAYIPGNCQNKKCNAHMVLHGCDQSIGLIGTWFIEYAGYNDVAESNDIIMLYPQVLNTTTNPRACWDFIGYTGPDYLTKDGV